MEELMDAHAQAGLGVAIVALAGTIVTQVLMALREKWSKQNDKEVAVKIAVLELKSTSCEAENAMLKNQNKEQQAEIDILTAELKSIRENQNKIHDSVTDVTDRISTVETKVKNGHS